jgi:hypothetical protein
MEKVSFRNDTIWAIFANVSVLSAFITNEAFFLLVKSFLAISCPYLLLSLVLGEDVFFSLFARGVADLAGTGLTGGMRSDRSQSVPLLVVVFGQVSAK